MQVQTPFIQRPLRGSRISSFYPVKSLPALSSLDSAFQLQEYISLLTRLDAHDVETITTPPGSHKDAKDTDGSGIPEKGEHGGTEEPAGSEEEKSGEEKDMSVDEACWIYEQLRRLAQDLTHPLITTLQQECSRTTCPEMKAGEWLYLCVAHGTEGAMEQCCAIDYILHTLDSATALLNSPRAFPSRLQIPPSSHRHFSSLARRLGRIFAHAYFHHREAFEQAEAESSLYARFLSLSSKFDLVPNEFLVIPSSTGNGDEEGKNGESGGFRLREVKFGTSYDPRRSVRGGGGGAQYQLQRSFQDEFLAVPRTKRLSQQYQQYPHQPQLSRQQLQHGSQQIQRQLTSVNVSSMGGAESPRKTGRNRTHTMVLSEATHVAEELAKAAVVRAEKEEKERREEEAKAREEVEREQQERDEAEGKAKQETEEQTSEQGEQKDGVAESIEENVGEGERAGKSTADVLTEEESAVETLLATPESEPTEKEAKLSESEEPDATPAKVGGEESGTQEVDIAAASIAEMAETSDAEKGEAVPEADTEVEVKDSVEAEAEAPKDAKEAE